MKVKLDAIVASPHQVRTTSSKQGLEDLAKSIKEWGLVVPVKVRPPNEDGEYELVYGHRRVQAAKAAGLEELEAIVEGVDDAGLLVQSLIENVQREDLSPPDVARGLYALQKITGWSQREMAKRGIMSQGRISQFLALRKEPGEVWAILDVTPDNSDCYAITVNHVRRLKELKVPDQWKAVILRKATGEKLTASQTGDVAVALLKVATSQRSINRLMKKPYSSGEFPSERERDEREARRIKAAESRAKRDDQEDAEVEADHVEFEETQAEYTAAVHEQAEAEAEVYAVDEKDIGGSNGAVREVENFAVRLNVFRGLVRFTTMTDLDKVCELAPKTASAAVIAINGLVEELQILVSRLVGTEVPTP